MNTKLLRFVCGLMMTFFILAAQATQLLNSQNYISNFDQTLTQAKSQTSLPLVFPKKIPKENNIKQLYASFTKLNDNGYTINIDFTSNCLGAHYCNLGSLSVFSFGAPKTYQNRDGKNLTQTISLAKHRIAYYTPGHSAADYWPPRLEWNEGNYFYSLVWNLKGSDLNAKKILIRMAKHLQNF